jgi:hypothetical protein
LGGECAQLRVAPVVQGAQRSFENDSAEDDVVDVEFVAVAGVVPNPFHGEQHLPDVGVVCFEHLDARVQQQAFAFRRPIRPCRRDRLADALRVEEFLDSAAETVPGRARTREQDRAGGIDLGGHLLRRPSRRDEQPERGSHVFDLEEVEQGHLLVVFVEVVGVGVPPHHRQVRPALGVVASQHAVEGAGELIRGRLPAAHLVRDDLRLAVEEVLRLRVPDGPDSAHRACDSRPMPFRDPSSQVGQRLRHDVTIPRSMSGYCRRLRHRRQ